MPLSPASAPFSPAGGTVLGREHARLGRNNQDGFALIQRPHLAAVVVTDGCSSGWASEVGARLGARFLVRALDRLTLEPRSPEALAEALGEALTTWLRGQLAGVPVEAQRAELGDLWLFTFLAAVVTADRALILGVGDGLFAADAEVTLLDAGPENAPPYAAYALLDEHAPAPVTLHLVAHPDELDALSVATDGLAPCPSALPRLAADPALLKNPFTAQRRLAQLSARERLHDDCSAAVLRRREA